MLLVNLKSLRRRTDTALQIRDIDGSNYPDQFVINYNTESKVRRTVAANVKNLLIEQMIMDQAQDKFTERFMAAYNESH